VRSFSKHALNSNSNRGALFNNSKQTKFLLQKCHQNHRKLKFHKQTLLSSIKMLSKKSSKLYDRQWWARTLSNPPISSKQQRTLSHKSSLAKKARKSVRRATKPVVNPRKREMLLVLMGRRRRQLLMVKKPVRQSLLKRRDRRKISLQQLRMYRKTSILRRLLNSQLSRHLAKTTTGKTTGKSTKKSRKFRAPTAPYFK